MSNEVRLHRCPACTTADAAWMWVAMLAELALDGDEDALRSLPAAIQHALLIEKAASS